MTWISSLGFAQGFAKSVEASAIPRTTPAAIERMSPSCTPDHAPIDRSSAANFGRREKKRKLCSDAVAAPNPQAEVHTIPPSESKGNSTFVQPYVSNKGAAEVSSIPPGLASKLSLIGGVEVLRDLKHTLFRLRSPSSKGSPVPKHETDALPTNCTLDNLFSIRTGQALSILRTELEATEIGEQLYRFRKRIALSQFFEFYEVVQANALSFLQGDLKTMRESSHNITSNQSPQLKSRVLYRIVDLMFPNTAHTNEENAVTASEKIRQMHEKGQRAAAHKKVQDWRRNGKPWFAMVKRFGRGILLLPKSLSDEK